MKKTKPFNTNEHILHLQKEILQGIIIIMATMQDLQNSVAAQDTADDSIITLLQGISDQLKDALAQNDPAAIQAIVDHIDANTKKLTDAVTANTPVAPIATQTVAEVSAS